jgi:hypothetical protein
MLPAQPSTHTPTIYFYPWTAKTPSTVSRTKQSFTQLRNTPPRSFRFSPGRTAARREIFTQGAPHDSSPVLSTSVVKQGDPLAPLVFALKLQGPLQRVVTAHPAAQIVAYLDDINVVRPAAAAAHAFEAPSTEVRTAGLTPVASLSAAYV